MAKSGQDQRMRRLVARWQRSDESGASFARRHGLAPWTFWYWQRSSFEGAKRAALLYSLVQSCQLLDVPPFDYLRDVLLRVATHPQTAIAQLTPRGWADTFGHRAAA